MMMAICARSSLSTVTPVGMKSGSMTEAMNRMLTSGTPRIISMKTVEIPRIAGSFERRPSARKTPSGKPSTSPTAESMKERGRPLQLAVVTTGMPRTPPYIRTP